MARQRWACRGLAGAWAVRPCPGPVRSALRLSRTRLSSPPRPATSEPGAALLCPPGPAKDHVLVLFSAAKFCL